jgi:hypothetical protein
MNQFLFRPTYLCHQALLACFIYFGQGYSYVICAQEAQVKHVARVALAVGKSQRFSANEAEVLRVGLLLEAGDRIRTGPDAFAIIVFSDDGRISVRPDSELWIKKYDIDPKGVNTRIEIELVKGTVRQISGNASRRQPDRYRLSTPVAAIGVRGTDFLAKTEARSLETIVQEGSIVIEANERRAACAQLRCETATGVTQVAGGYLKMASSGEIEQRSYRATDLEKGFSLNMVMQEGARRESLLQANDLQRRKLIDVEFPAGARFISDTIFIISESGQSFGVSSQSGGAKSEPSNPPVSPPSEIPPRVVEPPIVEPPIVEPPVVQPPAPSDMGSNLAFLTNRQLVWGRFSQAAMLPDQWLVGYSDAKDGRHVTVGEVGQYALWRSGLNGRLDSSLVGSARFTLLGAQAVLDDAGKVSAAVVKSASLEVNFDRASFVSAVDLQHQATGAQSIRVGGILNNEGLFVGSNQTERVAGAISRDGSEAGYLFSKHTGAGRLRGITLWTRGK